MKEINIYVEFLKYCEPYTEEDIEHIRQKGSASPSLYA